jgi:hypothetical protein
MPRPSLPCWLSLAAALLVCGCDREEIKTYDVPKPTVPEARVRLLVGIFEEGTDQWFFKFLGPIEEVKKHGEEFAQLLPSVRFDRKAKDPVSFTLPKGWEQKPGGGEFRHATLYPDPKNKSLEVSVSRLDRISSLQENVARWCRLDVGCKPPGAVELDALTTKFQVGDQKGVLVKLDGPGVKKGKLPPMMDKSRPVLPDDDNHPPPTPGKSPITYTTPAGWKDTGPRASTGPFTPPIAASFVIADRVPEVTVSYMGGGFRPDINVERWACQVGLGKSDAAEVVRKSTDFKIDGRSGKYYDLTGKQKSMLVVALERGKSTWYFKLYGDAAVVAANRGKFESFLQSVKFTGAAE